MAKEPEVFGFREPAATILSDFARRKGLVARTKQTVKYPVPNIQTSGGYFAKVPLTGIPARSGSTPGQATCDVYKIEPDGAGYTITDALFDVDIFNVFPIAVAFDASFPYFNVHQDQFGYWFNEAPNSAATTGIPFVNASSETIPPGGVMYNYDSTVVSGTPYIQVNKPFGEFNRRWLVNGNTAVASGGTSYGTFLDDLTAFVAISPPDNGVVGTATSWGPRPGSWLLHKYRLGFTPLDDSTTTVNGQLCGYFKQHEVLSVFGKYEGALTYGGSAPFKIYYRDSNNALVPAGWDNITVRDRWLQPGESVRQRTRGTAEWQTGGSGGSWEAALTACERDNSSESENMAFLWSAQQAAFAAPSPEPSFNPTLYQPVITP